MPQEALDQLCDLLDLEVIEVNIFRGNSPDEDRQRVFGGQVAGQALVAASRTLGTEDDEGDRRERGIHSLHAYFLRPGDPNVPILYEVDRIRDGRSFTTRRVVAIQHGRAIFNLAASFHRPEPGVEHQLPLEDAMWDGNPPPDPDSLPDFATRMERYRDRLGDHIDRPRPIDIRLVDWDLEDRAEPLPPFQRVWLRADGTLPEDPVLHTCLMTYASDMTLLDTTLLPHGGTAISEGIMMASLDHAMWFHRHFRADEWMLYVQDTPSTAGARGLARGLIYTQDGVLAASVVQEGLIRPIR